MITANGKNEFRILLLAVCVWIFPFHCTFPTISSTIACQPTSTKSSKFHLILHRFVIANTIKSFYFFFSPTVVMKSRGLITRKALATFQEVKVGTAPEWKLHPIYQSLRQVIVGRESSSPTTQFNSTTFMMNAAAAQISRNKISICSSRNCSYQSSSESRVCVGERMLFEKCFVMQLH